ncbi:hypothetical protein ACT8ZV_07795 [Nocardioides sp. MAHUQ-72]|uniref:hypothetical protein n=1 Tax=unclassified Nocardioides TaxID=2615069 RepID=UPI00360BA692
MLVALLLGGGGGALLAWRRLRSGRRRPAGAGARIRTARWDSTARTLDYRHTR